MILLNVDGVPIHWARPRSCHNRFFDSQSAEKERIRWQLKTQYREEKITAPLALDLTFFMPIPKSTSGIRTRQMINGLIHHIRKPDLDNLIKFILDCLSNLIIEDDNQIIQINARKVYSSRPATLIRLEKLELLGQRL